MPQPLRWHLILTVGQPGDPTADATLPWPPDRKQIDAGTLTIDSIESEDTSPTRDINFDPLVLPDGICAIGRPAAERALGGVFAVLHPARRRAQGAQRSFNGGGSKSSHVHDRKRSHSIRAPVAHPSLADGRLASDHAVHRRVDGGLVGRLPHAPRRSIGRWAS